VTIAKRPSVWDGMARDIAVIWVSGEAEYFLRWDWTGSISLKWFEKLGYARRWCGDEQPA